MAWQDRISITPGVRTRVLQSVLHNVLGTVLSRNSDYQGYWILGFLVPQPIDLRVNLLAPSDSGDGIQRLFAKRAATAFREQLKKADFPRDRVRSADMVMHRHPTDTAFKRDGTPSKGWWIVALARVETVSGHRFERQRQIYVQPHDPAVERRSNRYRGGETV